MTTGLFRGPGISVLAILFACKGEPVQDEQGPTENELLTAMEEYCERVIPCGSSDDQGGVHTLETCIEEEKLRASEKKPGCPEARLELYQCTRNELGSTCAELSYGAGTPCFEEYTDSLQLGCNALPPADSD